MRFKKSFINYLFILTLLGMTDCKKRSSPEYYYISNDLKQLFLYQYGSYWIYKNDKSVLVDSIYINQNPKMWQERIINDDSTITAYIDYIQISFNGKTFQSSVISYRGVALLFSGGVGTSYYYPVFPQGQLIVFGPDASYEYVDHFDSLLINNHYYFDVMHTKAAYTVVDYAHDTNRFEMYFARHQGLLKITKTVAGIDTTWTLLNCHAVQ